MKVLIYGINYAPESIGCAKYNTEMAEWLVRQGHTVDVITSYPHYPKWSIFDGFKANRHLEERIQGVKVLRSPIYMPSDGKITTKRRIMFEITFALSSLRWWLSNLFQRKRYDVIIAVCPPMQIAMFPWLYSAINKIPWVYHIQDLQVDAAFKLGMIGNKALLKKLLYMFEQFFMKKATKVSTISVSMRQRILEKGVQENHTMLFPNWSDIDFVHPLPRMNSVRDYLGVKSEHILVLYSGNIGKKQGLEILLEVAEQFSYREDIKFVLVGDGAERANLEKLAAYKAIKNISFFDLFPWEQVPELLAAGDIHIVAQNAEAADLVMPCKLTNILAAARVSIVTAEIGTGLYENMNTAQAGLVIPPNDIDAFAKALLELADNRELREEMGINARRYAEKYLSKEEILGDFEKQLQSIVTMC